MRLSVRDVAVTLGLGIALMMLALVLQYYGAGVIGSSSMAPSLFAGDIVLFEKGARPGVGDLLVFAKSGWPNGVVHRVIERRSDGSFRTRGDANPCPDRDPVAPTDVRGRVVAVVPIGKAIVLAARR